MDLHGLFMCGRSSSGGIYRLCIAVTQKHHSVRYNRNLVKWHDVFHNSEKKNHAKRLWKSLLCSLEAMREKHGLKFINNSGEFLKHSSVTVANATLLNMWLQHGNKILIQEGKTLLKSRTPFYCFYLEMLLIMKWHFCYETLEWRKKKAAFWMN